MFILLFAFLLLNCEKSEPENMPPLIQQVNQEMLSVDPFTFRFSVSATDQELDPLTYFWDAGDGNFVEGEQAEEFTFTDNQSVEVIVKVLDGTGNEAIESITINTELVRAGVDLAVTYQEMEGFGGFGAQDFPWTDGPFTSERFVSDLVDDLGITILRDEVPTNFEIENDNNDPGTIALEQFNISEDHSGHHRHLGTRLQYFRDIKAANPDIKFVASVWSPPPWMKANKAVDNGTDENSAPAYNPTPDSNANQLLKENYEEFAEMCVAYIKILKKECDIDLYAFSIQNEPRFSQSYQSCLYNGEALRDLLKVVGKRFENEGIDTKLFVPEDVGHYDGIKSLVDPILQDAEARQYVDILAVHGYAFDGVTAGSQDAATWQAMYDWGKPYDIPLWMTETSGFENTMTGAVDLAKAMYTAITYGNVSAWLFWTISGSNQLDAYNLMTASGEKSKRYYVSKNFYRYVRPGALRAQGTVEKDSILILPFKHPSENTATVVLINTANQDQAMEMDLEGLPEQMVLYRTSENENCEQVAEVSPDNNRFILKANSVITLYGNY
uniref:PKD domain-containing protein n=1 Tax=Roseihalotalea indica TaxID=2867963 RepID=A0AA49GRI8_9BACT|nr:PKD domain-containing protein [Tunicatimonas sp. TK19036]